MYILYRTETQKLKEKVDEITKESEEKSKTINQVFFLLMLPMKRVRFFEIYCTCM